MSNITDIISTLLDLDVPMAGIRGTLKKKGFSAADIEEALPTNKKVSFASQYYDWLAEEARSESEVEEYIMDPAWGGKIDDKGLTNIQRHLSHYTNIADMARRIHES